MKTTEIFTRYVSSTSLADLGQRSAQGMSSPFLYFFVLLFSKAIRNNRQVEKVVWKVGVDRRTRSLHNQEKKLS